MKPDIFVFNFHRISNENSPAYPPITTKTFEKIIVYLKKHYTIISQKELLNNEIPLQNKPNCIITFDDAYYDFQENAVPILIKHKCPATLHVVTETASTGKMFWTQRLNKIVEQYYIEKKSIYYNNTLIKRPETEKDVERTALNIYLQLLNNKNQDSILDILEKQLDNPINQTRMLRWNEIEKLSNNLISIGSHTHTHCNLATKDENEIYKELKTSYDLIKKHTGNEPASIAYPNGQYNDTINNIAKEIGYHILYTCDCKKNVKSPNSIYHRYNLYNKQWWKNWIKLTCWRIHS